MSNLDIFADNIYDTQDVSQREQILGVRLEVFGIIYDEVRQQLGLPALDAESRTITLRRKLAESALKDAQIAGLI